MCFQRVRHERTGPRTFQKEQIGIAKLPEISFYAESTFLLQTPVVHSLNHNCFFNTHASLREADVSIINKKPEKCKHWFNITVSVEVVFMSFKLICSSGHDMTTFQWQVVYLSTLKARHLFYHFSFSVTGCRLMHTLILTLASHTLPRGDVWARGLAQSSVLLPVLVLHHLTAKVYDVETRI